jgi:hypothetical protein
MATIMVPLSCIYGTSQDDTFMRDALAKQKILAVYIKHLGDGVFKINGGYDVNGDVSCDRIMQIISCRAADQA